MDDERDDPGCRRREYAAGRTWSPATAGLYAREGGTLMTVEDDDIPEGLVNPYRTAGRSPAVWGVTLGRVGAVTAGVIAVVDVIMLTALATLAAVLYNLCASFTGGLEVTLAEDA